MAPSFIASTASGTSPCPVMISNGNELPLAFRRFRSSMPSMPGMRTSETTHPKSMLGKASRKCCADFEQRDVEIRGAEQEIERIPHRVIVVDDIDLSPMRHLSNSRLMRRAT